MRLNCAPDYFSSKNLTSDYAAIATAFDNLICPLHMGFLVNVALRMRQADGKLHKRLFENG
jgi:hypothetical protein